MTARDDKRGAFDVWWSNDGFRLASKDKAQEIWNAALAFTPSHEQRSDTITTGGVAQSNGGISNTPSRQAKGRARSQAEVAGSTPVAALPSTPSTIEPIDRELACRIRSCQRLNGKDDGHTYGIELYDNQWSAIVAALLRSTPSATPCNAEELQRQLSEALEKLAAYEEPARRRARLESIVAFLFPRYDARRPERPAVIHPERRWWWNGAGIDENDVELGSRGQGAACKVTSYVGSHEYDDFSLEVPAEWMEAEDFKPLIAGWVTSENERRERNERADAEAKAKADLADAQRRLADAQGKNSPDGGVKS